jgi:hypothetical protein
MTWIVKRDGPCSICGSTLLAGAEAVWVRGINKMRCLDCAASADTAVEPVPIEAGVAGRSARGRHERLLAKREADLKAKWGERAGGWITRLTDEPQSTRAWAKGAAGEEKLASILAGLAGLRLLHDRRVPGKSWNIDHVVIAAAGLFVVDAKNYRGQVRVRRKGSFFNPVDRLYVGGRDCTKAAEGMMWQIEVLDAALKAAGVAPLPLITPVLCFIGADWPLFGAASTFDGVRLESERSIKKLVGASGPIGEDQLNRLHRILATALPPKQS